VPSSGEIGDGGQEQALDHVDEVAHEAVIGSDCPLRHRIVEDAGRHRGQIHRRLLARPHSFGGEVVGALGRELRPHGGM